MNIIDMYKQLVSKYGKILEIKLLELEPRIILTTFPIRGLRYKHIEKVKRVQRTISTDKGMKVVSTLEDTEEFYEYVQKLLYQPREVLGCKDIRAFTNLGFMRREFERALEKDGIYKSLSVIKSSDLKDLKIYANDYLIWVRVLDENGNIVRHFDREIKPNWTLDYMVCKVRESNLYKKRYNLIIKNSSTKTVCELCGEVKNYDGLTLDYKRERYYSYVESREENYCGCYNEYNERYTCIKENYLENMFRKAIVSKGYLVSILDISCDFGYGDNMYGERAEAYIDIRVKRYDSRLDILFFQLGFLVSKSEYYLYREYDNFEVFVKNLYAIYDNILKLPMNTTFLFKGYRKEIRDWKSISIREIDSQRMR